MIGFFSLWLLRQNGLIMIGFAVYYSKINAIHEMSNFSTMIKEILSIKLHKKMHFSECNKKSGDRLEIEHFEMFQKYIIDSNVKY